MPQSTPVGSDDTAVRFTFPAVHRKKVSAAFDGSRLTSDGGVVLLAQADCAIGLCDRLAACITDHRNPSRIVHDLGDILRARVLAIACGYEDADDLDTLSDDLGYRIPMRIGRRDVIKARLVVFERLGFGAFEPAHRALMLVQQPMIHSHGVLTKLLFRSSVLRCRSNRNPRWGQAVSCDARHR